MNHSKKKMYAFVTLFNSCKSFILQDLPSVRGKKQNRTLTHTLTHEHKMAFIIMFLYIFLFFEMEGLKIDQ